AGGGGAGEAGGGGAGAGGGGRAEDDPSGAVAALRRMGLGPLDAVVGVTASGRTPYVLGGIGYARRRGALTAGVSCNPGAALSAQVDHAIEVVVGPELIAGSTRMKAGTAQKLVLHTISTLVMVRLGRTFGNLMVGLRVENDKLGRRATTIVARGAGVTTAVAEEALAAAGGEVATALVTLLGRVDVAVARRRLAAAGGRVRAALALSP
ncbi:MAG: N-acetylmuramic acid 6-phosphate etherase, partial [Acidimicrobiales bacterium]